MGCLGRVAGAGGGTVNCRHDQENLRDADSLAEAAKEKDFHSEQKEIAFAEPESGKETFPEPDPDAVAATEKETFAHTNAERNADFNAFGAIKGKTFAYSDAERDSNSNTFAHTNRDALAFTLRITAKAGRAQCDAEAGRDQRLRKLFGRRAETSRLRPRTD